METVPPPDLIFRVTGQRDTEVFVTSGRDSVEDIHAALAHTDRQLGDFRRVLDFGCGCGRITRLLEQELDPQAELFGCDIDGPAIEWLAEASPRIRTAVSGGEPPVPFEPGFDLVIGWSVFTHLDTDLQDAWLAELARISAPGATLLLTVHGAYNFGYFKDSLPDELDEDVAQIERQLAGGFAHWRGDGWEQHFPDYYHTSWHLPDYVRERWSRWLEVDHILERGARPTQDVVVLHAR